MDREAAGDQGEEMIKSVAAALSCGVCIVALAAPAPAQAETREYRIPAGALKAALDAYARQSGQQVIYRVDEVRRVRSRGARGSISAEAALDAILSGTGFTARRDSSGALAIVQINIADFPATGEAIAESATAEPEGASEIIVTGTRIRGSAPAGSDVIVIDREEIERSGYATTVSVA